MVLSTNQCIYDMHSLLVHLLVFSYSLLFESYLDALAYVCFYGVSFVLTSTDTPRFCVFRCQTTPTHMI